MKKNSRSREEEINEAIDPGVPDSYRIRALKDLRDKYHEHYVKIIQYGKRDQDKVIDALMRYYIPNVLHDFPCLLNKIDVQTEYIKSLEEDYLEMKKQRDKAYKKLGWKIYQFFDGAAHEDDEPLVFKRDEDVDTPRHE